MNKKRRYFFFLGLVALILSMLMANFLSADRPPYLECTDRCQQQLEQCIMQYPPDYCAGQYNICMNVCADLH
jgi:hypothetical protein